MFALYSVLYFKFVILALITLAFYYLISKKEEESFAKTIVKKISASAISSTIVLFIYCLLFNICYCIYDAFDTYTIWVVYRWLPRIVLLISSPFVPLTFLTAFDASNKEKPCKILKYTIYIIITLVYYGAIISESFVDYSSFLVEVSCIIPFAVLVVCAITEAKGKPLTAKVYSLLKKVVDRYKNSRQCVKVKPDALKELKQRAKRQLGGRIFASAWLMLLFAIIINGAISGAASFTLIGGILVSGPMTYGLTKIQMKLINDDKKEVDLSDLFKGFSENFTQSILLGFLRTLFTALWSMLFVIPGIIKSYEYSMAFYVQTKSEDKTWKHALNESKRLMHGNKFKLFLLDLSFIGWYIVGSLCLGIGVLFVMPYHNQAKANFYASIMKNDSLNNTLPETAETNESMDVLDGSVIA